MEAVIFSGIQGSGKTSFYGARFLHTHVRIGLDLLHTRNRERIFVQTCLSTGQPFVVDNTNPRVADRAPYIALARAAGFRVIGYFFEMPPREALRRNAQRAGKAAIPAAGVMATWKRLERPTPAEGFDELYVVAPDESGAVRVAPWEAPVLAQTEARQK
jgi:predicted kinase